MSIFPHFVEKQSVNMIVVISFSRKIKHSLHSIAIYTVNRVNYRKIENVSMHTVEK